MFNILCCFPFGFIAILLSIFTRLRKTDGDLQVARRASRMARRMNIVATIGGIIPIIYYIFAILMVATGQLDPKPKP
jgi:hypothetical protein